MGFLAVSALVLEPVYPDIHAALTNRLRTAFGTRLGRFLSPIRDSSLSCSHPFAGRDDLRPIGEATLV